MTETNDLIALTIEVVSSYVSQNNIRTDDLPAFIASTHAAIAALDAPSAPAPETAEQSEYTPAVTARKSLSSRDHIVSMIDGKPYKTLKRHLSTNGLTPAEYRQRYGLKADYPMVAPAYSETRKALAQKIGLGRRPAAAQAPAPAAKTKAAPKAKSGAKGGLAAQKGVRDRTDQAQNEQPAADDNQHN